MGYQYALHQHKKKLREEKDEFRRSQENNSVSSGAYWDELGRARPKTMSELIEIASRFGSPKRIRESKSFILNIC
jgi:hypothetical protein